MKSDLTVKKMLAALELIGGTWPREKQYHVGPNWFQCFSGCSQINYELYDKIRELGFEDVNIINSQAGFSFKFIWKEDKKN